MIKEINDKLLHDLEQLAIESPRKRAHKNLHESLSEPVQRVIISLQQGTYVKPHLHPLDHKWELMIAVRGKTRLLIFDNSGVVTKSFILTPENSHFGVELPAHTWHTVLPLEKDSVILEIKQGPYNPDDPTDFASWAPNEGDEECENFLTWATNVSIGGKYKS